jgi:hypothetical protein
MKGHLSGLCHEGLLPACPGLVEGKCLSDKEEVVMADMDDRTDSEQLPEWLEKEVDQKVKDEIGEGDYLGYCHIFWEAKKRILHDAYGIDWKTPAERYPGVIFD